MEAGLTVIPPLGTDNLGNPCPTSRSFEITDACPSDNVPTQYLLTTNGSTAQDTTANRAALPGAEVINNASDEALLANIIDPLIGCTPFQAPSLDSPGEMSSALALSELQAATLQQAPIGLVVRSLYVFPCLDYTLTFILSSPLMIRTVSLPPMVLSPRPKPMPTALALTRQSSTLLLSPPTAPTPPESVALLFPTATPWSRRLLPSLQASSLPSSGRQAQLQMSAPISSHSCASATSCLSPSLLAPHLPSSPLSAKWTPTLALPLAV